MRISWNFEWISTWDEVWSSAFLERWLAFIEQADHPHVFSTPPLVRAWWRAAQNTFSIIAPCFMVARSSDGATVFMPLVIVTHGIKNVGLRVLQTVGSSEYDYHDPIAHGLTCEQWPLFWAAFATELTVRRLRFDQAVLNGFRPNCAPKSAVFSDRAPYIPLAGLGSADTFLGSLSGSLRGDIRRQLRRLEEVGPISFRILQPDETHIALDWLPEILAQHAEKWPNSYKLPGFHAALIREALPAGLVHLSELKSGDTVVSRHLGFFFKHRFYWYMPVYNTSYHNYSPGKLHLYFCALDAMKCGGVFFDLLRGEEDYKRQWTALTSELYEMKWHASSPASKVRLALVKSVIPALQKLRGAIH